MAWEALNNIAAGRDRNLVIVVNDNERSYAKTIGGLAEHLATLRTMPSYERVLDWGKNTLQRGGTPGRFAYDALHSAKKGIKDFLAPQGLFEDLGLKYVGPVDGHDIEAMEHALGRARSFGGPVIVHAITRKGEGYAPAENDEADRFHAIGVNDPATGAPLRAGQPSWTGVFAEEVLAIAEERPDVVGVTAAMLIPVGLHRFAARFPERVFDVGIAEQHAVTSAAGMAAGGLHPVVAVYSTFINRAFDQVLMDVALHRAGVTFVLDRAGITGEDGASHHGMWDLSLLSLFPSSGSPRRGTPRACARSCARRSRRLRAPPWWASPSGGSPARSLWPAAGGAQGGGMDLLRRVPGWPTKSSWWRSAMAPLLLAGDPGWPRTGSRSASSNPRWVLPGRSPRCPAGRRATA
jgi:1-deoxy-D-xylulose-5-phosphate synthase